MDPFVTQVLSLSQEDTERLIDNVLFIDPATREITVPPYALVAGAAGDKDVNWINFKIPRYYDGSDFSEFQIRINYLNANGDPNFYTAQNKIIKDDAVYFSWLITMDAVAYSGDLTFGVSFITYEEEHVSQEFNTKPCIIHVGDAIHVEQYIDPGEMEDIIARVLQEVADYIELKEHEIDEYIADALEEAKEELLDFDNVHQGTSAYWDAQPELIGTRDHLYIYRDVINDQEVIKMKISDGSAYLIDQPFLNNETAAALQAHIQNESVHIQQGERAFWNSKVSCHIDPNDPENLIFTTEQEE